MDTQISTLSPEARAARAGKLGGSDAAAALGLSKWKTPIQLWQEKTGRVPEPDLADREFVQWGVLLEDVIADEWARRNGRKAHRVNQTQVSKQHDWMVANIDRRIVGVREGLEVKNTSAWVQGDWGEEGTDEVPPMYLIQGLHCMHVMDYEAWNYAVLVGGNELRGYRIERSEKRDKMIVELETRFMEHVWKDTPPDPVEVKDVYRLYPNATGTKQATNEIMQAVVDYQNVSTRIKELEAEKAAKQLQVAAYLGEASDLLDVVDPTVTIATYRNFKRKGYEVKPTEGRTFRVK